MHHTCKSSESIITCVCMFNLYDTHTYIHTCIVLVDLHVHALFNPYDIHTSIDMIMLHACIHTYIHTHMHCLWFLNTCISQTYIPIHTHTHTNILIHTCMYMYIYICVCVCVYVYVCVCVCVYVYIYSHVIVVLKTNRGVMYVCTTQKKLANSQKHTKIHEYIQKTLNHTCTVQTLSSIKKFADQTIIWFTHENSKTMAKCLCRTVSESESECTCDKGLHNVWAWEGSRSRSRYLYSSSQRATITWCQGPWYGFK